MEPKLNAEEDMDILDDSASVDTSNDDDQVDDATDDVVDGKTQLVDDKSDTTGSSRLDRDLEKRPDMNLDRILDRMRSRDETPEDKQYINNQAQPYRPLDYEEGEYSSRQLEQDREAYARIQRDTGRAQGINEGLGRYKLDRFVDNLELDAERVATKHPELDENSEVFSPTRADRLNRMYYNFIGYDDKRKTVARTDVRYRDFIDAMMGIAEDIAGSQSAQTTKNVARQAARAGVRPGGSRRTPSLTSIESISNMSHEEYSKNRDQINRIALELLESEK